jgi:hypothetical protein
VNLVAPCEGLALGKRDIDLHVYTDPFVVADSFAAVGRIAADPRVKSVQYANLMAEEDRCLEWHAQCEIAPGETWKLDMIHIAPDSRYVGFFERVAARITAVLNEETRLAILDIKRSWGRRATSPHRDLSGGHRGWVARCRGAARLARAAPAAGHQLLDAVSGRRGNVTGSSPGVG